MFPLYQPFQNEWLTFTAVFILISMLVGFSELARLRFHWSPTFIRNLVHVIVGVMVSLSPFYFTTNRQPLALAGLFTIVNLIALRTGQFQGIHAAKRTSYGTVFFPLAYLILCWGWWSRPVTLIIAMALMALADPLSASVGQRIRSPRRYRLWRDEKTVEGSVTMFLASFTLTFLVTTAFSWFSPEMAYYPLGTLIGLSGLVAGMATLAEGASYRGSDNLSVPLLTAITYELFLTNSAMGTLLPFLLWLMLSLVLCYLAAWYGALSPDGAVAAFVIGLIIFGAGGIPWITPLILFFVLSSLLSKSAAGQVISGEDGPQRTLNQVLANGGIAALIALVHFYYPLPVAYPLFLAAVAAATADTWATEIGLLSKTPPRHIVTRQIVPRGTSGGITALGTAGAALGAGVIAVTGSLFGIAVTTAVGVFLAGFSASLIDSLIGGTVQSTFTCRVCGHATEHRHHCGQKAQHSTGWKWIDNDIVNWLNTGSGVLLVLLLMNMFVL
jgi:uncharacterized protein (TIGR00297 family)